MTIIVDMDDVLCDCTSGILEYVNSRFGMSVEYSHLNSWHALPDLIAKHKACSRKEAKILYRLCFEQAGFFSRLKPKPHAIEVVTRWAKEEYHNIVIATKIPERSMTGFKEKFDWIQYYFPGNAFDFYGIVAESKRRVRGDVLIDDSLQNLSMSDGVHTRIVFDHPWNREPGFAEHRAADWREVERIVKAEAAISRSSTP